MMKVLIGCECSGVVRRSFRDMGHDAWSCDLKPAEDDSPYHIQGDVLGVLDRGWDLMVAHPVCKYLTNSGVRWLSERPERWALMEEGADFYLKLWDAPIERVAVENPVWHGHAKDYVMSRAVNPHPAKRQFVQPWMFGHMECKATGLALRGLPRLVPTDNVREATMKLPYRERCKVHFMPPSPTREADRSRTLEGLGRAMALQWG